MVAGGAGVVAGVESAGPVGEEAGDSGGFQVGNADFVEAGQAGVAGVGLGPGGDDEAGLRIGGDGFGDEAGERRAGEFVFGFVKTVEEEGGVFGFEFGFEECLRQGGVRGGEVVREPGGRMVSGGDGFVLVAAAVVDVSFEVADAEVEGEALGGGEFEGGAAIVAAELVGDVAEEGGFACAGVAFDEQALVF